MRHYVSEGALRVLLFTIRSHYLNTYLDVFLEYFLFLIDDYVIEPWYSRMCRKWIILVTMSVYCTIHYMRELQFCVPEIKPY